MSLFYDAITGDRISPNTYSGEDDEPEYVFAIVLDGKRIEKIDTDARHAQARAVRQFERTHGHKPTEIKTTMLRKRA